MNIHQAMQLAVKFASEGNFGQADKILRDILDANNQFHPAIHMLGQLAFQSGRDDIAAPLFQRAVMLDTNNARYHRDLSETLFYMGKYQDCLMAANRSIQLNEKDPKTHFVAGNALTKIGEEEQAIKALKQTIRLDPNHAFAHNNLGSLSEKIGKLKEAKRQYETAIKLDQKNVLAYLNLSTLLTAEGDLEGSRKLLNAAIKTKPDYIEAHHNLSALKKYKKSDKHIDILKALLKDINKIPVDNQIRFYFILGKAHADIDEHDRAFDFYKKGNQLKRSTYDYQEDRMLEIHNEIKSVFSRSFVFNPKPNHENNVKPIFVVGMPRSGSTLVEQIISSHSKVHGGGELLILNELVHQAFGGNYPFDIQLIEDNGLQEIGEQYLNRIASLNPDAEYIVDKMPSNYLYAGLISKILPDAIIINTNRNPMDCCVSIYTHLFLDTVHYTNDLGELGRYFKMYSGLMDHWRDLLPDNVLYDVSYEKVVGNLEQEARDLIDFIGLDWENGCLDFHKKKSNVKTASAAQVRKPIYKSSIERWRVYEDHLKPLSEELN
jgi:tetratricopeptide (TPR) repeat protein